MATLPSLLVLALLQPVLAAPEQSKTKVTLFGQPCLLTGPFAEPMLLNIHSVSPEKMPAPESEEQAKAELTQLKKATGLPTDLDRYRELLTKRLESLQVFYGAISGARKTGSVEPLLKATKPLLEPKRFKDFQASVKKLLPKPVSGSWTPSVVEQVKDEFDRLGPPDPQEEFHRAIRRMKVHYACSFEESGIHEDEEDAEPGPSGSPSPQPSDSASRTDNR